MDSILGTETMPRLSKADKCDVVGQGVLALSRRLGGSIRLLYTRGIFSHSRTDNPL